MDETNQQRTMDPATASIFGVVDRESYDKTLKAYATMRDERDDLREELAELQERLRVATTTPEGAKFSITSDAINAVLGYLGEQPYKEVAHVIEAVQQGIAVDG